MNLSNSFSRNMLLFIAPVSFLLLASCGSYQYSGYESDGIYGDTYEVPYGETEQNATQDSNSGYYKKLFAEEAALYGDVMAEGAIFTDVESYTSTVEYDPNNPQQVTNYQGGNAPWGQDPDRITINFHNNGFGFYNNFYNPYWGYGFGYNPYWGPFYGPGYWGPWGMGYAGLYPYGGYGFGFSIHPYFYGGYGYYNPYNFYNHYRHHNNNVAYNTGRRNSISNYSNFRRENLRDAVSLDRGRTSSYSRSIRDLRNSNQDGVTTRRTYSRDYESRVNADSPYRSSRVRDYNRTSRRSDGYNTGNTRTRSSGTVRSSNSTRSSSPAVRSSGSSRSSGTVRSSSGSGRSSGSRGRNN